MTHDDKEVFLRKLACVISVILCVGCGGGGGGGENPGNAPTITNLNYSPSSAQLNEGGGTVLVTGTIDFTDQDGDVSSLTISTYNAAGQPIATTTSPVPGAIGKTSGAVAVSVSVPTTVAGSYTFQVFLTDATNHNSNHLSGTFSINPGGSGSGSLVTGTGPSPSHLVQRSGELFWSEAGEKPINKVPLSVGSAISLAMKVEAPAGIALHGTDVFWLDSQSGISPGACTGPGTIRKLKKSSADGSATVLLGTGSDCYTNSARDLVVNGTDVYWVTSTGAFNYVLQKTPISGGSATTVVTTTAPIVAMAGDAANLYWMENRFPDAYGAIRSMPWGGGPVVTLASGFISRTDTFAINSDSAFYSVANFPGTDNLVRVPLAGGSPTRLATLSNTPVRLVADSTELYLLDGAAISHMPAAGGSPVLLASAVNSTLDMVIRASDVVWTETTGPAYGGIGAVKSVPKAGGSVTVLAQGEDSPGRLAVNASWVYWTEGAPGVFGVSGRIARVAAGGGTVGTVISGITSDSPPIAVSNTHVFVADGFRIKKIPLAGGMPEPVASGSFYIKDLVTDNIYVYWVEDDFSNVFKAPVGGGAATFLGSVPAGIAAGPAGPIRLQGGIVYWMTNFDAIISVPAAGGTSQVVASGLPFLNDFVVDDANIYFSENDTGKIRKVSLIGKQFSDLAQESPSASPIILATDGQSLYWINQAVVGKVPITGGTSKIMVPSVMSDPYFPGSIAIDNNSIFWTEPPNKEIRSISK